jgi:primosomal protein N' (replication factor Y) (superfamily II helicase)
MQHKTVPVSTYADLILPLAIKGATFTYAIPAQLKDQVAIGMRVEVPFGKSKLYSAIIATIHDQKPAFEVKEIIGVLDDMPVTTETQLKLWAWISTYYCCTLGEVMTAALPGNLKLSSETRIIYCQDYGEDFNGFTDDEYLIAEALLVQKEISLDDARKILNKKTVFPAIQMLMKRGVAMLREELIEKFVPKKVTAVRLCEPYRSDPQLLSKAFALLKSSERQQAALLAFLTVAKTKPLVLKQEIVDKTEITEGVFDGLRKKGILETYAKEISRLGAYAEDAIDHSPMSEAQKKAYQEVKTVFTQGLPCLLHGVTGSGKTRLYVEAITETMAENQQVLYLVPEITLTTQLIQRLQRIFGNQVVVYHSKVNYNERAEIYKAISQGGKVVISARSGLFLPFQNLGLVIVDEEHDGSYKQNEPAPRYQARDAAIVLAHLSKAKVLLGTGTPSLESYQNAVEGKFGLVTLSQRFGALDMPLVQIIDLKVAARTGTLKGAFSTALITSVEKCLDNQEQAILFQNRRGFAPVQDCQDCEWSSKCPNCDVSLTYHKGSNRLRCHYCGHHSSPFSECPRCKSRKLVLHGHGTERLEDDLDMILPKARIARMDFDTVSSKAALENLLLEFEEKRLDVLIGTQMVTKGLDFDHVGLVGVISADQLLKTPNFRASERAWQLLVQVSGRAGRKHKQGLVLIQTWQAEHPVIKEAIHADFQAFSSRELAERKRFKYPPYYRLIQLTFKHKTEATVAKTAQYFAKELKKSLGERIFGPAIPSISRVRGYFLREIMIKLEKDKNIIEQTKQLILDIENMASGIKEIKQSFVSIDVDP